MSRNHTLSDGIDARSGVVVNEGVAMSSPTISKPRNAEKRMKYSSIAALKFMQAVIQGKIPKPSKEQMQAATEIIKAYSAIYGKVTQGQAKRTAGINIKNAIITPGKGGNEGGQGAAHCTNAKAYGNTSTNTLPETVHPTSSAKTIYEHIKKGA